MTHTVLTAVWTGFAGAPGYTRLKWASQLATSEIAAAATEYKAFWNALAGQIPNNITITLDGLAQFIDTSGTLVGQETYTAPAPTVGSNISAWAAPSGGVISWLTDTINNGRRVRGRSFIVPLAVNAYDDEGTLAPAAITAFNNAAAALGAATPNNVIFSQPGGVGTTGVEAPVTAHSVADKVAILRSRRD
jgi:hypothetical protein